MTQMNADCGISDWKNEEAAEEIREQINHPQLKIKNGRTRT